MKVAALFAKFSPHHEACLHAAALEGEKRSSHVVAAEIAASQSEYMWPDSGHTGRYERVTLASAEYSELNYSSIRSLVHNWLTHVKPDAVLVPGWGTPGGRAAFAWCLEKNVPTILLSDSHRFSVRSAPGWIAARRILIHNFDAALVAGTPHKEFLVAQGFDPEAIRVGCDVVDNRRFASQGTESRCNEPPIVLSALRLLPGKNIVFVLDAMRDLPGWQWWIAGHGPLLETLKALTAVYGLGDRVKILGLVPHGELPGLLGKVDAYLQPSLRETWGLAVNEAMAAGLPVLVSERCGCARDLVVDGINGFLFDPTSRASLGVAINSLLESREQWGGMGAASRTLIDEWGPERYALSFWQTAEIATSRPRKRTMTHRLLAQFL